MRILALIILLQKNHVTVYTILHLSLPAHVHGHLWLAQYKIQHLALIFMSFYYMYNHR